MKTPSTKNNRYTAKELLKDVEIPDDFKKFLTEDELALLTYSLAGLNIKELAKACGVRSRNVKTEIVWRLIQLGQRLAMISVFEQEIIPNWTEITQKENVYLKKAYMNGFTDCKTQVQRIVNNGIRKQSGR
jgi:hypothetical protein